MYWPASFRGRDGARVRGFERAGGGNYQTLINDALVDQIRQSSMLDAVRQVLRGEISAGRAQRIAPSPSGGAAVRKAVVGR